MARISRRIVTFGAILLSTNLAASIAADSASLGSNSKAPTTVTLATSANPSSAGQPVTFTATVLSASGTPTGTVTFRSGSAILGVQTLAGGVATFTTTPAAPGTESIKAVYHGSADFSGSTSLVLRQVVNPAPSTVALTSSANPSNVGQPVTFTATVVPQFGGSPSGVVVFSTLSASLGVATLTDGVATLTTSTLIQGTSAVTATYFPSGSVNFTSATLAQTVYPAGPQTYTLATSVLNPSVTTAGNSSASSITLTPVNGYAGSVSLSCNVAGGGTPAPSCAFSPSPVAISGATPGSSTLTVSAATSTPAGTYSIAIIGADANGLAPNNSYQALTLTTVPAGSPNYTLAATALSPGSITTGNMSASTVTVTPANGYTGSVNLSCNVSGAGTPAPSCTFNPSAVAISGATPGSSTLTVFAATRTPAGTYSITVTGADADGLAPNNGYQALALMMTAVIQHVVIIFQENRTPDNLFQDPVLISQGADIASGGVNSLGQMITLSPIDLGTVGSNPQNYDNSHDHKAFIAMYDGGKMDGANLIKSCEGTDCPANPQYQYVKPADVRPYFAMAERYTFGDRMFQSNQGPSFPAHQFIISGTSAPTATSPLFAAENPNLGSGIAGCIAALTDLVSMIDASGSETNPAPEYPCFEHQTLSDLLNIKGITWRYYVPNAGSIVTAPNAIEHICQQQTISGTLTCTGPEWNSGVVIPQTQVLTDIANRQLPQVSWVIPVGASSDHASANDGSGPAWVASIVNAIGNTPYWANTAIIITWDDWGGWYDHVTPTVIDDGVSWGSGYVYGFRVPLVIVSPYAKPAYISHVTHDFGSILKFIETTFNLPSLGYADSRADDLSDCFDLTQTPISFQVIPAPLDAAFFINDKRPPTDPDDD